MTGFPELNHTQIVGRIAEGKLRSCFLFHDYFKARQDSPQYKDYYFGALNDFIAKYETRYSEIMSNYAELRQDFFQVEESFCFLCEENRVH